MTEEKNTIEQKDINEYSPEKLIEKWKGETGWRKFFFSKKFDWIRRIVIIIWGVAFFALFMSNIDQSITVSGSTASSIVYIKDTNTIIMSMMILTICMLINKIVVIYRDTLGCEIGFYKWLKLKGIDGKVYIKEKTASARGLEDKSETKKETQGTEKFLHILAYNECKTYKVKYTLFTAISTIISCLNTFFVFTFTMLVLEQILKNISALTFNRVWSIFVDNIWYIIIPIILGITNLILTAVVFAWLELKSQKEWIKSEFHDDWEYYYQKTDLDIDDDEDEKKSK